MSTQPLRPPVPTDAPNNAAEAADQLSHLVTQLLAARDHAKTYRNCRDKAETLYRGCKSRALIDPTLDGRNQAERDARAHEWTLDGDRRAEAVAVAESMGLTGFVPETVGDLRWLRDRSEGLAESASARAYDLRAALSGWQTVASMAKAEAELGRLFSDQEEAA